MIVRYPKDQHKIPIFLLIIVSLVSGILGGIIATFYFHFFVPADVPEEPELVIEEPAEYSVIDVAKHAMPSVVGITTISFEQDSLWGSIQRNEGIGTGVIVHEDGYILTNSHVLENGNVEEVRVILNTGEKHPAQVLWFDQVIDLAVIRIDATGLPVAKFGDSEKVTVGESVVAIGNPLGLSFDRTVTSGIISGLNRTVLLTDEAEIDELIQTDASINPGNSGGPLLNMRCEVIGINTVKIQSGEGLGFAIPIKNAKTIIEELIETGSFEKVKMGVRTIDLKDYEDIYDVDFGEVESGVYIIRVFDDSAAARAGLMDGDILIGLDDASIESTHQLNRKLYQYRPGDIIFVEVIREGERLQIQLLFD